MHRPQLSIAISLGLLLASWPASPTLADACRPIEAKACTLWLRGESAPRASASCSDEAWSRHLTFEQPKRFSDSDKDGWAETVLSFRFPPEAGCGCVFFRIHYAENSTRHSAHIGNSATNNGFGGDAGTVPTLNYAEAHMGGPSLMLFSGGAPGERVRDTLDPFAHHDTDLLLKLPDMEGRTLEIEVCDQSFAFAVAGSDGPALQGSLETPLHRHSFVVNARSRIYAAFNRVIRDKNGAPNQGRVGSGVERVEFFLSP
ncbi:MAG: hypothetical protein GY716_04665 [bacterium]|nr:hypothetical protein [bacterium]